MSEPFAPATMRKVFVPFAHVQDVVAARRAGL
jgi:hypothetical protein